MSLKSPDRDSPEMGLIDRGQVRHLHRPDPDDSTRSACGSIEDGQRVPFDDSEVDRCQHPSCFGTGATNNGRSVAMADDEIMDATREALRETDRRGVTPEDVAECCHLTPNTLRRRLRWLSDDGQLAGCWVIETEPKRAYQLPDDDDDPLPEVFKR